LRERVCGREGEEERKYGGAENFCRVAFSRLHSSQYL
jgi:hypothetical protein